MVDEVIFAGLFTLVEGWGYATAFYHCLVTASTVGYGDVAIETPEGHVLVPQYGEPDPNAPAMSGTLV